MSRIIGIDPGLKGGIAAAETDHSAAGLLAAVSMPIINGGIDAAQVYALIRDANLVVIEKVHAMPKQGVKSTFTFGMGYGALIAACDIAAVPYVLVTPQLWKKTVLAGLDWKGNKRASIEYIRRRFPYCDLKPTNRCTKDSDGLADAACLAIYGLEHVYKKPEGK